MVWGALLAYGQLLLPAVAVATLILIHRRDREHVRAHRGAFFSRALHLFDSYRVTQDSLAYPDMRAVYRGYDVRLEPVVDDIAWRKIPSLWLKVTVFRSQPNRGVFDFIVRPRGVEFYSPSGELAHHLRVPAEWPQDALFCSDDPEAMPCAESMAPHISLFDDPQMKELLVAPRGTRLVRQIWQADRAYYLVLRQAKFAEKALDPELAKSLLDAAIRIAESLRVPEPERMVA